MGCGSSSERKASARKKSLKSAQIIRIRDFAGVLSVQVVGARDLAFNDLDHKVDPFCTILYHEETVKTATVSNNRNPEWNHMCLFPIGHPGNDGDKDHTAAENESVTIRIAVYDEDSLSANDLIGAADLIIPGPLKADLNIDEWLRLQTSAALSLASQSMKAPNLGDVHVKATFAPRFNLERMFWYKWFKAVDTDQSNNLNRVELSDFFSVVSTKPVLAKDLDRMFGECDANKDGRIGIDELVNFMAKPENEHLVDENAVYSFFAESVEQAGGMVSEESFMTQEDAARGWLMRLTDYLGSGHPYDIRLNTGSSAKHILVIDRKTKLLVEEYIDPNINFAMRALYQSVVGSGVLSLEKSLDLLKKASEDHGKAFSDPSSKKKIPGFVKTFNLSPVDWELPMEKFETFNEFFYRKLKPGARPIADEHNPYRAVSPADCRCVAFPSVSESTRLWIKGENFSIDALLGGAALGLGPMFAGGSVIVLRLAPQDYHRFHIPVDGVIGKTHAVPGSYYTVNPIAVNSGHDVFIKNKRAITLIDSPQFGVVAYVAIGATLVGSIVFTTKQGDTVKRGDEHGYFAFGGSTIILVFKKETIRFDKDLLENSQRPIETLIRMGTSIGVSLKKPGSMRAGH